MKQTLIIILSIFGLSGPVLSQTFSSSSSRVQLLELYSSQGCSSCPPAERWVSRLSKHPELWNKFIPLVFHVDYWNYLGWKDPFSNQLFSQRQRKYYSQRAINSVYTPGMILDGMEWRGWYRNKDFLKETSPTNTLSATLDNKTLTINYSLKGSLNANIALLGFGLKTHVKNGENHGKSFTEDFVVLSLKTLKSETGEWTLPFNINNNHQAEAYALAIWVNTTDSLVPLQAAGGWLITD